MSATTKPKPGTLYATRTDSDLSPQRREALRAWREEITTRLRKELPDYSELGEVLFVVAMLEAREPTLLEKISERAACPEDRDARSNATIARELQRRGIVEPAGFGRSERGRCGLRRTWVIRDRLAALQHIRNMGAGWLLAELGLDDERAHR